MIRFLIRLAINLVVAALALWVTSVILEDFNVTLQGLVVAAVIFALLQAVLAPFVFNMARKYADFLLGGVGLVSTFLALWITTLITGEDGLEISSIAGWIVGTLLVWLITALGGWALGLIFLKKRAENR
ncbi:phage holin family protein [Demequina sp.]|uniref:phage holin family protein n=1 Tax=Demequina sp. TaxID=2050685 RepID=UPI003D12D2F1